ncbi:TlpA family protein disulfide reductase [Corynebacterium aquilae]|uniref:Thioredoxin domain-containing protein n=1 Tax=Corynebacterium aquilae DSM 44791 TaxID=1431546 RepID=A0A1L7CDK2_9CORY|nr:TlpA disulfide reductase family protein [Corynebacterium aquilae]APT83873.1 hypothetical protein CAQU_00880 [Corynebacterium aquilae DSM 44791]
MKRTIIASIFGAVVIGVLLALVISTTRPATPADDAATDPVAAQDSPAAPVAQRPDCPVNTIAGVNLDCLGGQAAPADTSISTPTVVTLWAWWCGPCRAELPLFDELAAAHPDWTVLGVHVDAKDGAGAQLLSELGSDLPSLKDPNSQLAAKLSLPNVVPITIFISPDGTTKVHAKPYTSFADLNQDAQQAFAGAGR